MSSNLTLLNNNAKEENNDEEKSEAIVERGPDGMNLAHKKFCYFRTVMMVSTFIVMGMTHAIKYTSIPDLRILFHGTAEDLSLAIAIGTVGGAIGGPLGIFADKFGSKSDLVVCAALLVAAVTFISMPFSPYIWLFGCLDALCNMSWAWSQAATHGIVSQIWGPRGGTARYALHFGYPIGSMVGPLIALPFMTEKPGEASLDGTILNGSAASSNVSLLLDEPEELTTNIYKAYTICSIIIISLMFGFLCMYICGPRGAYLYKNTSKKELRWKEVMSPSVWANGDTCFGVKIMLLMFTYYLLTMSTIKGTQMLLTTFIVDSDLGFSSKDAATLNSLVYGIGTLGRGVGTVAVRYLHINHLLVIETHGLLLLALLCLFVGTKFKIAFWILVPCLGFFREPLWPSGYVWTNNYIILFGVLVGLNDVVFTLPNFFLIRLQGYLYTSVTNNTIFYTTVGYGAILCVVVHIMNYIGRSHGDRINQLKEKVAKEDKNTSL